MEGSLTGIEGSLLLMSWEDTFQPTEKCARSMWNCIRVALLPYGHTLLTYDEQHAHLKQLNLKKYGNLVSIVDVCRASCMMFDGGALQFTACVHCGLERLNKYKCSYYKIVDLHCKEQLAGLYELPSAANAIKLKPAQSPHASRWFDDLHDTPLWKREVVLPIVLVLYLCSTYVVLLLYFCCTYIWCTYVVLMLYFYFFRCTFNCCIRCWTGGGQQKTVAGTSSLE